jgi:hypothetical protein
MVVIIIDKNMKKIINPFKPHVVQLPDGGYAIRLYRICSPQFLTEFGTYTDCVDNLMLFRSHFEAVTHLDILTYKRKQLNKAKAI